MALRGGSCAQFLLIAQGPVMKNVGSGWLDLRGQSQIEPCQFTSLNNSLDQFIVPSHGPDGRRYTQGLLELKLHRKDVVAVRFVAFIKQVIWIKHKFDQEPGFFGFGDFDRT